MTRTRMLEELRSKLRETGVDPAWGETRLLAWLAEGQDEFCEHTGYFVDNTSYTITLADGVAVYAIPDRVIQVLDVFDGTRKLGKFQEEDRPLASTTWNPTEDPTVAATPTAWQADRASGFITFNNTPQAADDGDTYQLRVWRYSLFDLDDDDIDGNGLDASPEIPRRYHWAPIEWACSRALVDHDLEAQDPVKAATHRAEFDRLVRTGKRFMRRQHGRSTSVGSNLAYQV